MAALRKALTCQYTAASSRSHTHMNFSGPLISPAAKSRIEGLIASAVEEGGQIHLDGRNVEVQGYPLGNFVGPTILEAATTMKCYRYILVIVCVSFLY